MTMVEQEKDTGRATSDPEERRRVLEQVGNQVVRNVHLWFTDLEGHL